MKTWMDCLKSICRNTIWVRGLVETGTLHCWGKCRDNSSTMTRSIVATFQHFPAFVDKPSHQTQPLSSARSGSNLENHLLLRRKILNILTFCFPYLLLVLSNFLEHLFSSSFHVPLSLIVCRPVHVHPTHQE